VTRRRVSATCPEFAVDAGAWSRLISADRMVRFHRLRRIARSLGEATHATRKTGSTPVRSTYGSVPGRAIETHGFSTRARGHFHCSTRCLG